ncbi:ABC transporter permease [Herbiconiux sp. L3-i23]|uniref:ABC transporter permease n=1 Tax=Herbiconiux sp. L3-i23 TaxID=2905871 RepID=UPI0020493DD7|nr:ABC transporter permease [Herbiconiux sp. L3-i23]BDI21387.1 transport permease protein [Herbiconiux sp. L3-i23]
MTASTLGASPLGTPELDNGLVRTLRLGGARAAYEVKTYFRQGDSLFFTFLFPTVIFIIFAIAFGSSGNVGTAPDGSGGVTMAAYYLPGMVAAGVLLSGVQNLAIDIATERSDGTLKRLAGTPLPVLSYFLGKLGQVLITSLMQLALLLIVARVAFGVELPSDGEHWWTFIWVYLLGIATAAALGIGLSRLPRSGKSASAVIVPILLVLQFVSGVYIQFTMLPDWLQNVAGVFPLKWIAQGMRAAFLPESFAVAEAGGSWDLGTAALVLGVWLVAGVIVSVLTFRWNRKDA